MEPDHVAVFTTGSACEKFSQSSAAKAQSVDLETSMPIESTTATPTSLESARLLPHQNHGPPGSDILQRLLRSTVLLV
jgi:hypothetical protein